MRAIPVDLEIATNIEFLLEKQYSRHLQAQRYENTNEYYHFATK